VSDVIETGVGRFWLEDGLLRYVAREGNEQSRAEAEDSMRVFAQLAAGKRRPAVMVILGVKKLSRDARAIYTGPGAGKTFLAVALVVAESAMARGLVNFILAVSKPEFPTRMFETVDEAVAWAKTHVVPD
jgi:hypothetical protein